MWSKYERARKWQLEQKQKDIKAHQQDYPGKDIYEEDLSDHLEKGDMLSLMLSGFLTIFPACVVLLLLVVFIGLLFMHII